MTASTPPLSAPVAPPHTPTSPLVDRAADLVISAARVVFGLAFAQHGAQKLLGWFADPATGGMQIPVGSLPWFAGVLELGGGLLLAAGLFARPVAFLLAGMMAVAYFMAHAPRGFWPILNKGESAVLYCFAFLVLWAVGPGRYSVDALLGRGRRRR
jgi:putative oxidoreductase